MFYIFVGVLLMLLGWLLPIPYPVNIILIVVGLLILLYGVWIVIPRGPHDGTTRRVRRY